MSHELKLKIDEILNFIERYKLERQEIFTVEEAAKWMNVSTSFIYKLTSCRKIPFYKPSPKLVLFKKVELELWLFKNRQAPFDE